MFSLISKSVIAVSLAIGALFVGDVVQNDVPQQEQNLGQYNPSGGGTYRLKTSIGTTDTTVALSEFKEPVSGVPYTMTYLNTEVGYGTLDPQNTTRSEFISFTGITQNADGSAVLTGVTRGLSRSYPYTASSTLRQSHAGQSIFILSDSPQHFSEYAIKRNDEVITGQWTFTTFPVTASTSFASETVVGAVELSTGQEAASSTASGGTGYRLALPTSISTSTAPTSGHVIPVTGSDGNLDSGFIPALSTLNLASTTVRMTAGTTTNGATLPVPVYASTTDDEVYKVDADNYNTHLFIGFAVTNGVDGGSINVQTSGVVEGFTGLSVGDVYYVQDVLGTIGTSTGTYAIPVGRALTTTSLLIQKRQLSSSVTKVVDGTAENTSVVLGWRPYRITVQGASGNTSEDGITYCVWHEGVGLVGVSTYSDSGGGSNEATCRLYTGNTSNYMEYTITANATGYTLNEAETGTFNSGVLILTAESSL